MKAKACEKVGFYSITHNMPDTISQDEIIATIEMMNTNPRIDGILVQLPLPKHVDTDKILEVINPKKDVDGFHSYNVGRLVSNLDSFVACTPLGVMKMFEEYNIELQGKDVCVVGASNIVGKPMSALLLNANATVTTTHIFTKDLKAHTSRADIIIVGVGVPNLIKVDMVKDDAIVIDIGINRIKDGSLVGDVDFKAVSPKCSYITPVPGGVGPMTIAMLLSNTLKSAKQRS
jgi:methylenetetrahydrofolate dehydrogenase (NADP+)/methenyltetrahydrofolate cyclohydrolase